MLDNKTLMMTVFAVTLVFLFFLLYRLYKRKKRAISEYTQIFYLEILIPVICVIFLPICLFFLDTSAVTLISISIFLINIIAYALYGKLEQYHIEGQTFVMQEQQYKMKEEYYLQVEEHQKEVQSIKDNIQEQLEIIGNYINSGEEKKADRQIDELVGQISGKSNYDFTVHAGMNALLSAKVKEAELDDIKCEIDAKLPVQLNVDEIDMAVLVGNLFDNAIEACRLCESDRYILFRIIHHNDSVFIHSENSTKEKVKSFRTRKKDTLNHGLGIDSINAVVGKYNGSIMTEPYDDYIIIKITLFER